MRFGFLYSNIDKFSALTSFLYCLLQYLFYRFCSFYEALTYDFHSEDHRVNPRMPQGNGGGDSLRCLGCGFVLLSFTSILFYFIVENLAYIYLFSFYNVKFL
jgi:hypothetical protein